MTKADYPNSALAVEGSALAAGLEIGRTSVARYVMGCGNPTLDQINTLARLFDLQPWQLLHPNLGLSSDDRAAALHKPGAVCSDGEA